MHAYVTQEVDCYDYGAGANPETDEDGSFWDYQWCTEQFQPFSKDGENDMYWDQVSKADQSCCG